MLNNPEQILHQIQQHLWKAMHQATAADDVILRKPRQQRISSRALFSLPQGFNSRSQCFRPYVEELLYELDNLKMQIDSPLIDVHISLLAHKLELVRSELRRHLRETSPVN